MKSTKPKVKSFVKVTFEDPADVEALVLAKMGASNKAIAIQTALSNGQITYRLSKAKHLEHRDTGYRVAWRNGESDVFRMVHQDIAGILRKEIARSLPKLIIKPTPQTVKVNHA
jgi:hypothetical protein